MRNFASRYKPKYGKAAAPKGRRASGNLGDADIAAKVAALGFSMEQYEAFEAEAKEEKGDH